MDIKSEKRIMNRREWKKPINILMLVMMVVSAIPLLVVQNLSSTLFFFLSIPFSLSMGYISEHDNSRPLRPPTKVLVRFQSLLFPVGGVLLFLIIDAHQGEPVLSLVSDSMFWIFWISVSISWLVGSTLFRYLRIGALVESQ
jgi:UDP-N-acetylmuramyl pentapeptide phosphotransferase/UDP-N-acetylglucosamine-1-phosphate transferase